MRYIFTFPDIGEGISEGTILEWYVEPGQKITSGENLVQVETDKVTADIPSPRDGAVVSRFGKPGEIIKVGDALVELDVEGVSGEEARQAAREPQKGKTVEPVSEESFGVVGKLEVAGDGAYLSASTEGVTPSISEVLPKKKVQATPVARAVAKDLGVDINEVSGTGPRGRVTKEDIEAYYHSHRKKAPEPATKPVHEAGPPVEYAPLTQLQKTIASKMAVSKHTAAHFTAFEEVEVSKLVEIRASQKERFEKQGVRLTYLPFIMKAVAAGLKQNRLLNSSLDLENNRIIYKNEYNIGIAVDTPDGLVVPVIRSVDTMPISRLARVLQETAQKARDRHLTLDDLRGGTFTITNYGSLAGIYGTPVINYPEVAILGVGRLRQVPIVRDGAIGLGSMLPLSLSADHRLVDGAAVARFLMVVMSYLQDPVSLIMEE